ncbi:MAG: M13 family peptidase, partial [Winogradskyella sp.]|nr:M13 family peptidase [Winogradskyella sp.]
MRQLSKISMVLFTMLLFVVSACKEDNKETSMIEKTPGIVLENMDTSVDPKQDFYNYVNGNWMKTNTIPDDEARWGGFGVLRKSTRADVLEIIKTSKELGTYKEGSDQKKALLIFESELDTIARAEAGVSPIKPALNAIASIQSIEDMQTVSATTLGVSSPFAGIGAGPDLNNSTMNTCWVAPGGLGLQRDYYLEQDEKNKEIRQKYKEHITKMLQYIDYTEEDAKAAADLILELETQLAEPRLDKVARRDIRNMNNPRTLKELQEMAPAISWKKMIDDMGVEKQIDTVMVMQPK